MQLTDDALESKLTVGDLTHSSNGTAPVQRFFYAQLMVGRWPNTIPVREISLPLACGVKTPGRQYTLLVILNVTSKVVYE